MLGGIGANVFQSLIEGGYYFERKIKGQVFGCPIFFGGWDRGGHQLTNGLISVQGDSRRHQALGNCRHKAESILVNQHRLNRVTHAGSLNFRVVDDLHRLLG